jgi:uncharacterized membrane protein YccC
VGAGIGVIILILVKDRQILIGCMIILMIFAYSFMRTRYLLFVTLMTPYILIVLYLLNPTHFQVLILDRVIDTAIGSGIALLANILFSPEWAYQQFAEYLQKMLDANKNYFADVSSFFVGMPVPINSYKLSRKEAYVALANMSDSLNRMIAEPKSKQKNAEVYHELVVLNYMMSTHIATLAGFGIGSVTPEPDAAYLPVVNAIISNLIRAREDLQRINKSSIPVSGEKTLETTNNVANQLANMESKEPLDQGALSQLNEKIDEMVQVRKKELRQGIGSGQLKTNLSVVKSVNDQFNFILKISGDLLNIIMKSKLT